ncbi:MAG: LytTR family DNA-binding domain-containing protein [Bacteroidales bacterium]|nr:LytTR family DNA-binding domain-containing protein [Bacteroidales bacterium]
MITFIKNLSKKMLRTIIIDDEAHVRESMAEMLKIHCPDVKVVGQAEGVKSGVKSILKHHPDLILLDIKMKDGTGFDLLEQVENIDFKIIFITAYDQFAIKAIKFSALDYLLKPVDSVELQEAINKAENLTEKEVNTQLSTLASNLQTDDQSKKRIILKTFDNIYLVKVRDIVYAESDSRYSTIYLESGEKVIVSKTLKHYHELLGDFGFYRVHKSFLINLEHIQRFEKAEGGYVILEGDAKVPVASRKKEELLELFERISE